MTTRSPSPSWNTQSQASVLMSNPIDRPPLLACSSSSTLNALVSSSSSSSSTSSYAIKSPMRASTTNVARSLYSVPNDQKNKTPQSPLASPSLSLGSTLSTISRFTQSLTSRMLGPKPTSSSAPSRLSSSSRTSDTQIGEGSTITSVDGVEASAPLSTRANVTLMSSQSSPSNHRRLIRQQLPDKLPQHQQQRSTTQHHPSSSPYSIRNYLARSPVFAAFKENVTSPSSRASVQAPRIPTTAYIIVPYSSISEPAENDVLSSFETYTKRQHSSMNVIQSQANTARKPVLCSDDRPWWKENILLNGPPQEKDWWIQKSTICKTSVFRFNNPDLQNTNCTHQDGAKSLSTTNNNPVDNGNNAISTINEVITTGTEKESVVISTDMAMLRSKLVSLLLLDTTNSYGTKDVIEMGDENFEASNYHVDVKPTVEPSEDILVSKTENSVSTNFDEQCLSFSSNTKVIPLAITESLAATCPLMTTSISSHSCGIEMDASISFEKALNSTTSTPKTTDADALFVCKNYSDRNTSQRKCHDVINTDNCINDINSYTNNHDGHDSEKSNELMFQNCGYNAWVQVRQAWRYGNQQSSVGCHASVPIEIVHSSNAMVVENVMNDNGVTAMCRSDATSTINQVAKANTYSQRDERSPQQQKNELPQSVQKELVLCIQQMRPFELSRSIPLRCMIESYCEAWEEKSCVNSASSPIVSQNP